MAEPFRLGIAGLGTVGVGVIKVVQQNGDLLAERAGRPIEITCVSARSKDKDRGVDISSYRWIDKMEDIAAQDDVDAVIEVVGGSEGGAYNLVKGALSAGKHVITANKALVAHHGVELGTLAEKNDVSLAYEAAVAGGIPIIKAIREGLTANKIDAIHGILNGTCNYILTQMRETGRGFEEILVEAQELGYAEADPSFDIGGIDTGHKIALLAANAFGMKPDFNSVKMTGIAHLTATDINFATELGYKIKLLGIARCQDGQVLQTVEPCLVPIDSPLGAIEDVYNAVFVSCDFVETPLFTGRGAGEGPTASSVVADVVEIARGLKIPTFGIPMSALKEPSRLRQSDTFGRYYLRLSVLDQSGVMADVSAILRDNNISIEGLIQHGRDPGQSVPVVITTHEVKHADVVAACDLISRLDVSSEDPCIIRIEHGL